ncbi:MAG TPA: hypothetical protein VEK15_01270 [Vicinamibacteria bacterium]|nr:hypothetical protein [Vicinamibacteria bacterium]
MSLTMRRIIAGSFLVALFVPPVAFGQPPPTYLKQLLAAREKAERSSEDRDLVDARLEETIDRIGRAFELGDAEELGNYLQASPIHVSLKAKGEEAGYYRPSQLRFIFAKLFRERETDSFTYDSSAIERTDDESARFHAEWKYVLPDEDRKVTEHLRFKLERKKEDWRISEIRNAPR